MAKSKDEKFPKGFVYFTLTRTRNGYTAKEYNNFLTTDIPAAQQGNLLHVWNHELWGKIFPDNMSSMEAEELSTWENSNNGLFFNQLNATTAYLRVPSFYNNDSKVQALVSCHDSLIRTSENLIIDLRGNGGGNTGWIYFLPYLITDPIRQPETYLRVSAENVQAKRKDLEPFVTNPIPDEYKKYFPAPVLAAYKKAYEELPTTQQTFYPVPGVTFPVDSVMRFPKKVALVFDGFCGSSTEYFFYLSAQSSKVVRYGTPTIGMMDYEGMSTPTPLPYDKFILTIPIARSGWTDEFPIDSTGFIPEIRLDRLAPERWIEFIMEDMKKR